MAPEVPLASPLDGDGIVLFPGQPVSRQVHAVVVASGRVEPPVLGYPEPGVVLAFHSLIDRASACGAHLKHEIRRLALFRYEVAVAGNDQLRPGVQRDEQIRVPDALTVLAGEQSRRYLAQDYGGFRVSEMRGERTGIPRQIDIMVSSHLFRRRVGEPDHFPSPEPLGTRLGGHRRPRGLRVGSDTIISAGLLSLIGCCASDPFSRVPLQCAQIA